MKIKTILKNIYYDYFFLPYSRFKNRIYYKDWDMPSRMGIETTSYCNFRCKNCPNSKYERGLKKNLRLLPEEIFKKFISDLKKVNYKGILFFQFFGEPLTDKRIFNFVRYARDNLPDCLLQINTNGALLTQESYNKLIKAGVDNIVVTEYTLPIIDRLRKELGDYNITYRRIKDIRISDVGGEIEVENNLNSDRPECIASSGTLIVDCEGNIVLCCNDYHSSFKFGNIKEKGVFEIWHSPNFVNLRKKLYHQNFDLTICKKCIGIEK